MEEFLIKFFVTGIIFSLTVPSIFFVLFKQRILPDKEIFLYSLGIGPVLTSLLLYYLLLIFPHKSNLFYFLSVLGFFGFLSVFSLIYLKTRKEQIREFFLKFKNDLFKKKKIAKNILLFIVITFSLILTIMYLKGYVSRPLFGHDALVYGVEGKIYYAEKSLDAKFSGYYPKTGFDYFSLHAPAFPLVLTWEKILNNYLNTNSDYYFKSMSPYYGFLILLTTFLLLKKKNIYLAIFSVIALLSGLTFFLSFNIYHIDTFRIYFLMLSWLFLGYAVEKKDIFSITMFGIFTGFASFIHSIGAIIAGFNCLGFLIFADFKWLYRLKYLSFVVFLTIIFGWFHYIIDIFYGQGWIFHGGL